MRAPVSLMLLASLITSPARAQQMSTAERAAGVSRAQELARCLDAHHDEMQRIMRMIAAADRQRDTAHDAAARRDAEASVEALLIRVERVRRGARECLDSRVPTPAVRVVERTPPADPVADAVARAGDSIPTIERDATLSTHVRVVIGQQVDGSGRLDRGVVRAAVRRAAGSIARCYERYLDRGSIEPTTLDLVFSLRGSGAAHRVVVENSHFHDRVFERCVRQAGSQIRASASPRGGDAMYSYRLRFGAGR